MLKGTYSLVGFIRLSHDRREFVVYDFADVQLRGQLAEVEMKVGDLLRAGRIEQMLNSTSFKVGMWLVAEVQFGDYKNRKVQSFKIYNHKEYIKVANRAFVTIMSVDSEVPSNITNVSGYFNGAQSLPRIAWASVANRGEPYQIPIDLDINAATEAAKFITSNSNAYAVVVDAEDGKMLYDPKLSENTPVSKPVNAAPVIAPAPVQEKRVPYFYIEEDAKLVFSQVASMLKSGITSAFNILITGPSGVGKTSIARMFAEKMGYEYHRLNCALITEASEFGGQREIVDGDTKWEWSAVAESIAKGNAVVVLDEINRAYPNAMNALFALLDDDRRSWFGKELLTVGPNVVFVATMNQGSEYTGTFQIDHALSNRFSVVLEMGNIPDKEEKKVLFSLYEKLDLKACDDIVRVATALRLGIDRFLFPIRTTKAVALLMNGGMSHRAAWEFAVVYRTDVNNRKPLLDIINQALGTFSPEKEPIKSIF